MSLLGIEKLFPHSKITSLLTSCAEGIEFLKLGSFVISWALFVFIGKKGSDTAEVPVAVGVKVVELTVSIISCELSIELFLIGSAVIDSISVYKEGEEDIAGVLGLTISE